MAKRKMKTRKRTVDPNSSEMYRSSAKKPEADVKPRSPSFKQRESRLRRLGGRKI